MRILIAALAILTLPLTAAAQTTATVTSNAPIFVTNTPTPGLQPLRTAAVGTVLRVLGDEGEWLMVEFQDPRWGRRVGWVEKKHVTIKDRELEPVDLSIPEVRQRPSGEPSEEVAEDSDAREGSSRAPSRQPTGGHAHSRDGFWFNVGLGLGSLGCEDCGERQSGLSGGLSLGGTLGEKWLLGVGTTGWAKEIDGELFTVGTLDARFRFYPMRTSGFFLTGGLGVGTVSYSDDSEFGVGAVIGIGWDIRVGRNVSITPFWNGFAMQNDTVDANVGQIGVGVTLH